MFGASSVNIGKHLHNHDTNGQWSGVAYDKQLVTFSQDPLFLHMLLLHGATVTLQVEVLSEVDISDTNPCQNVTSCVSYDYSVASAVTHKLL